MILILAPSRSRAEDAAEKLGLYPRDYRYVSLDEEDSPRGRVFTDADDVLVVEVEKMALTRRRRYLETLVPTGLPEEARLKLLGDPTLGNPGLF